jgi:transposase
MALGRQGERQTDLMVGWAELPRSPGHAFYDRLQAVLIEAGFDGFAETQCAPYYASAARTASLCASSCVWRRPSWCPIIPG